MLRGRHAREFSRALDRGEWERTPQGIHFPKQRALLRGRGTLRAPAGEVVRSNLLGDQAPAQFATIFEGGPITAYFAPLTVYAAPLADWRELDFWQQGELGDPPDGYTQSNRQPWAYTDAGGGVMSGNGVATINTTGIVNVYGFGLSLTSNVKRYGAGSLFDFVGFPVTDPTAVAESMGRLGTKYTLTFGANTWLDTGNDDYFDVGLGQWVDPGLNSYGVPGDAGAQVNAMLASMLAAVMSPTPLACVNGDMLTMQYDLTLE